MSYRLSTINGKWELKPVVISEEPEETLCLRRLKAFMFAMILMSSVLAVAQVALAVESSAQKNLLVRDWAALPHRTLVVTNPLTKKHETYEGVVLCRLRDEVGVAAGEKIQGVELRKYVVVSAKDGYAAVVALAEVDPSLQKN